MNLPVATMATFLGTASESGISWWQTLGGLAAVFGLLLVSLKALGKWNRRSGASESSLLKVLHLGPKREIQILRVGDQVHYIYRHDGAMVALKTEPLIEFENSRVAEASA